MRAPVVGIAAACVVAVWTLALPEPEDSTPRPATNASASSVWVGGDPDAGEGGPDAYALASAPAWVVPSDECVEVRELLREHGVDVELTDELVWIARRESACGATRVNRTSGDYGVWQVNWRVWGAALCEQGLCVTPWELAHDDDVAVSAALLIHAAHGFDAWCWASPEQIARGIGYACPWT